MKQMMKILTGFTLAIVLVGVVCLLAIQYLDVIMKVLDAGRRALRLRREEEDCDDCCTDDCCCAFDDDFGADNAE